MPYAGGSARIFDDWQADLPEQIRVHPLELPGRGGRYREAPATDLPALADELTETVLAQAEEPVALLGYSFGAFLAFEVALRLEQRHGRTVRHLVTVSARGAMRPPKLPPGSEQDEAQFRARLYGMGGTPQAVLASEELMELLLPVLRADFGMSDHYSYRPGPVLRCPITAFGGSGDTAVSWPSVLAWRECTIGPFVAHQLPGDHFFPRTARARFLDVISTALRAHRTPEGQR